MSEAEDAPASTSEVFETDFATLSPLILAEWPAVDGDALRETSGDLDRVVDLVADRTQHTKTLVRHMLRELGAVASHRASATFANGASTIEAQLQRLLDQLERKTADIASELRGTLLRDVPAKVRDNLWSSLFMALGLGFVFGIVLGRKSAPS